MTIGFDGIRTATAKSKLNYYDRLLISSLGMEYPHETFMVYTPENSSDRGLSWLLSIPNVHLKTPYKAFNKWMWRNWNGIYTDFHRHGVKLYHGVDSVLPLRKNKEKVKMVTTVRDLSFKRFMDDYTWCEKLRRSSRIKKACKKANRVIATSEYLKDKIINKYHIDSNKIDVIYSAYRDEYESNLNDKVFLSTVKNKYNIPTNFVLAITDFGKLSNMEMLYKAFANIDNKDIDLVIIGAKNDYYRQLKKLADKLNIEDRIVRISRINKHNFMGIYALSQAYIDTSLEDGMGQNIIEALFSETPVIACDDGCHREIAKDAALYFQPDDIEQLTKHINTVLSNSDKRQSMKQEGKKIAEKFTQQALAQNTMLTYDKARGKA